IAQAKAALRALAYPLPCLLLVKIRLIIQCFRGNQAFDEQLDELHEEAKFGNADDEGVELLPQAVAQETRFFPLDQFALSILRAALGLGGLASDRVQLGIAHESDRFSRLARLTP